MAPTNDWKDSSITRFFWHQEVCLLCHHSNEPLVLRVDATLTCECGCSTHSLSTICWSIDCRGKSNSPAPQSKKRLSHWGIHFENLETRERLGICASSNKESVTCCFCPICYHDNPILLIILYDIWVWHCANHHSPCLISRAAVCPDTHAYTAFYELLFSCWDESNCALSESFFIPWDHRKVFFLQSLELGLPRETWRCMCFCSPWFIPSFFPWGSSGVQHVGRCPWPSTVVPGDPAASAFFPLLACLSSGVHVWSMSVFRRKFKTSTLYYVVLKVHHIFRCFEYLSLSSGVWMFSVSLCTWVWIGNSSYEQNPLRRVCISRNYCFSLRSQQCVSKSVQALKNHSIFFCSCRLSQDEFPECSRGDGETIVGLWLVYGFRIMCCKNASFGSSWKVFNAVSFVHLIIQRFLYSLSRFVEMNLYKWTGKLKVFSILNLFFLVFSVFSFHEKNTICLSLWMTHTDTHILVLLPDSSQNFLF